jgi:hypothetical protein
MPRAPIAIFYEHPEWFRPLFTELERRGLPFVRLAADRSSFDPAERDPPYGLVFNRASPSAHLRGRRQTTFYTLAILTHWERRRVPVVNGSAAYRLEISKAAQLELLDALGLGYPRARVINHASQALAAAEALRWPILVKANVGGSGAGIARFDAPSELAEAVAREQLDLGVDHTALVQECCPLRDGRIVRVEVLGRRFLYALEVFPPPGAFNLCPADACQTADGRPLARPGCAIAPPHPGLRVQGYVPPPEVILQVEAIAEAAALDVGGIEYLVDDRDSARRYYDINALSNFVADAPRVVGLDPFALCVDYLKARWEAGA